MIPLIFCRNYLKILLMLVLGAYLCAAKAAPITLSISQHLDSVSPGGSVVFSGVITNRTGTSLQSTDLLLNFFGFDEAALFPTQLLGDALFTLPNLTFSREVDLFRIDVAPASISGIYDIQVALQDINGSLSDVNTTSVTVGTATQTVPEPSTVALVGLSLALMASGRRIFRHNPNLSAQYTYT